MSELIDNRAHRIRTLKHIIRHLHEGKAPDEVKAMLKQMVAETDATEIAAMEQELIDEGMPAEEVQSMCDLHSEVLREVLVDPRPVEVGPGHPVDTLRRENEAIAEQISWMRNEMDDIRRMPDDADPGDALLRWRGASNALMDVEKHYARKENLLFSMLERHDITGPSKVMWGKDDEVRELLAKLNEAVSAGDAPAGAWKAVADQVAEPTLKAVEEMIYKEDKILLPMALNALTEEEWGEIFEQSPEYGWCLVDPREGYAPPIAEAGPPAAKVDADAAIQFATGALTPQQLGAIFGALPVDLTFVDADDRVRFFSEGEDRVFARSKAILGRKVQHCHPPKSVDLVDRIVEDFKSGRQDVAEFWIQLHGKFVHIRYFALRDDAGEYLGTLEVTQDATRIRALKGDRRLLSYDGSTVGNVEAVATAAAAGHPGDAPAPPSTGAELAESSAGDAVPGSSAEGSAAATAGSEPVPDAAAGDPDWLLAATVVGQLDADVYLARGEHPLEEVRTRVASLAAGQCFRLDSGFKPMPLIQAFESQDCLVHCRATSPGRFSTWIAPS